MSMTVRFTVVGEDAIHCPSCEQRVVRALQRVPGVQDVHASAQTQEVTVTVDPEQISPERVRERLHQIGYETEPASPTPPAPPAGATA